jgi:phospholipid transport system substrate-binding protein
MSTNMKNIGTAGAPLKCLRNGRFVSSWVAVAMVFALALDLSAGPAFANQARDGQTGNAAEVDGRAPAEVIETLSGTLLYVMRNADNLGFAGRYEKLEPVLSSSFHFGLMARTAIGRDAWDSFTEEQQSRYLDLFERMSITNFAARFTGWSGEEFEVVGERELPRRGIMVFSRLVRPVGEPVQLNYLMREFGTGWRIIDIFLDGQYSEIARNRSEFSSILRQGGFEALEGSLVATIRRLEAPAAAH